MADNIIELRGITKRFSGTVALSDVSFDIKEGETHCLCGENGAGKSTLINLLGGVLKPDEGTILVDGKEVEIDTITESERLGIGIVHQEVPLCLNMTIAQNVFLGHVPLKSSIFIDEKEMNDRTAELLKFFRLDLSPSTILSNLSIAEQSIVQIAKVVYQRPRVLILDEPTAALTNDQRNALFEVLDELREENNPTILYVSHRLEEVKMIGDRITVLKDGQYVTTVSVSDVSIDDIIALMVGRDIDRSASDITYAQDEVLMSVKNLSRNGKFNDISFDLKKGEIIGLAGFVGAGRTEVLTSIFGGDRIDEGEVWIKGEKAHITSPSKAIEYGIGMIPENRRDEGLISSMSIMDNAQITLIDQVYNAGMRNEKAAQELMDEQIEKYKMKIGSRDDNINTLSGGNQQKVVIAKWIGNNPDILFCDEPTRGIDVGAKDEIYNIIRNIAEKGIGVVVVSSELPELLMLCDRILVMHEGKMTGQVTKQEATEEKIIKLCAAV